MENLIKHVQLILKLQFIGDTTEYFQHFIRAHIICTMFPFLPKPHRFCHGGNFHIDPISFFEFMVTLSIVGIRLLSTLSPFSLSLITGIFSRAFIERNKNTHLPHTTQPRIYTHPIKCLNWCHGDSRVIAIVVG